MARSTSWRSLVPGASLAVLSLLVYLETLSFGYIWDDQLLVELDWAGALERAFNGLHVRPLWYLSYVVSQSLSPSPVFEHAVNLALFSLSVVLAHRVALGFLAPRAAWLVTVVWTLLPWNAYPVTWIAQRNDLLVFVFGFASLLAGRQQRYRLAWLLLAAGLFSKITLIAVPLYFVWWAWREGRERVAAAFLALFLGYLTLALRGYLLYFEPGPHLAPASWILQQLRFPAHWLEHLVLLVVPLPFFVGIGHAALYLFGLAGLGVSSRAVSKQESPTDPREAWILAGLASLAAVATPALRICGFESLFWLIAIAQVRRWRFCVPAAVSLALIVAAYAISLQATKPIFDSRIARPASEGRPSLYPNEYYRLRRAWLRELAYPE
ncbi:MAG: hypothetical protein AAF657_05410 [Acidobacteriota bacterium]